MISSPIKPISIPDDDGTEFEIAEIPAEYQEKAEEYRTALLEAIAEVDEEIMMKYLEGEEISVDEIKAALRKGVCNVEITPVLCGSSYKNKGVQPLLDAVIDYLPSPLDVPAIEGKLLNGEEDSRKADDEEPFSALAFKIMTDPYVGKLTFFRVYSGSLKSGSYVLNSAKGKRERIGRILQMHANHREEISEGLCRRHCCSCGFKGYHHR